MTNKELLELITIAKENNVNNETIRELLKLAEQDGKIAPRKVKLIKELLQNEDINDPILWTIFKKAYQKHLAWHYLSELNNHLLIKGYLLDEDYSKEEWEEILKFVCKLPHNIVTDSIYVKWLRYVYSKNEKTELSELSFFHRVLKNSLSNNMLYSNWYFTCLLDQTKPLSIRYDLLTIIEENVFYILEENISMIEMEYIMKKIVKCYELYESPLTGLYATVLVCKGDMAIPVIEAKEEYEIYILLYKMMCRGFINEKILINFTTSLYYKIATNPKIPAHKRLEFIKSLTEEELVLKDKIVFMLWQVYDLDGLKKMKLLKYALLNKGIRTNPLCRKFLMNEKDEEVLSLAITVLKNNRIRKDQEGLNLLHTLEKREDKIRCLHTLEAKYPDNTAAKVRKEQERMRKEQNLLQAYNDFLSKKSGLGKLITRLEESENLDINLIRERKKKNDGRKI